MERHQEPHSTDRNTGLSIDAGPHTWPNQSEGDIAHFIGANYPAIQDAVYQLYRALIHDASKGRYNKKAEGTPLFCLLITMCYLICATLY